MITRPLDLASKLQPSPRGNDALFYVNVGLLAVFFGVFGSKHVLSPGLAVDFALPVVEAAASATLPTDAVIAVPSAGTALVEGRILNFKALGEWLRGQALGRPGRRLLVHAAGTLPAKDLAEIYALAADAGFAGVLIATERPAAETRDLARGAD